MDKYGEVALLAVKELHEHSFWTPPAAWRRAAAQVFPDHEDSQKKLCPRGAFLGLCEEGLVVGVPAEDFSAGSENKSYAVDAVRLLRKDPSLAEAGAGELWKRVMKGRSKKANSQMDVVLSLWTNNYISLS
jgi:hypothetical protein